MSTIRVLSEQDQEDLAADYMDEYLLSLEYLPQDMCRNLMELRKKEIEYQDLSGRATATQSTLFQHQRYNQYSTPTPQELQYIERIRNYFIKATRAAEQKCAVANESLKLLEDHLRELDEGLLKIGIEVNDEEIDAISVPENIPHTPPPHSRIRPSRKALRTPHLRTPTPTPSSSSTSSSDSESDPIYCLCRQGSYGDMVGCDNEHCPFEWFHYECVGLTKPPVGMWFCPRCRVR
ncbi:uncharacterized protein SPPG_01581 [Spizellomyces punctatus DAOM BR117]|uniref:Chromatin modification-related protein n=1 Tax=Spizellomyces punctatus (strain DAOM BR117) TaxID=645134 RepID=A0A0L0HS11_SPIPD|nr:uncharacterized protein SPPG_01581 [Spizellomyces punctatus DAOM BR117]KND04146.1 hypothetical protein SPPG_01581 [Spizellomyces punctatus DAOM BR117]|eukprot:XP_016612185.1 hypothetical protein SPPG_01581 [Spizellomyces punctatus DAOM BR117]